MDLDLQPPDILLTNDNIHYLYITFIVIVAILLLWIIIVVVTKDNTQVNILKEINNTNSHIKDVIDQ